MNPGSLVASAAINFGLAFFVLSLFSILKKQPSNAPIYYARRVSKRQPVPSHHSFTLCRFLPSISWIPRALRVTEDEVIQFNGLDALIIIRLFKFGIRFFGLCSLLGLIVILPINYGDQEEPSTNYHSLDAFTISNISTGSNRLWVHFFCLWVISFYALYLLYKEYDEIQTKRIQQLQNLKHRPEQFTVLIRQIPFCVEHKAYKCSINHFFYKDYRNNYHSSQIVYDGRAIQDLLDKAKYVARKIEELEERSTARKHQKECLLYDASPENDIKTAPHVEKLREILHKIRQLQDEDSLKEKADFFVTYILTDGLSGFSFEILQPGLLLWAAIESKIFSRAQQEKPYVYSLRYFAIIPSVSLSILIGMVYAVVAPLLLPFLVGYFYLGYIVYLNQIEDVYQTLYETCGQYWPYIHHYILVGVVLMQITMIGLFGLKSKPAAAIATIPLLLFTIMFNEYCKIRFFPTFRHYPIQSASDNDEVDYKCGQIEANYDNAAKAYCQPTLRLSSKFVSLESTLMQPLVSSF